MGRVKGCGLSPWKVGDDFTAKLAHYFGMIWALSAGREGLPPTQSLIGDGVLSLSVCVCVSCALLCLHGYACACTCTSRVCEFVCTCMSPVDKLCVCQMKHTHSQLCQGCACVCLCVCVPLCVRASEQVNIKKLWIYNFYSLLRSIFNLVCL